MEKRCQLMNCLSLFIYYCGQILSVLCLGLFNICDYRICFAFPKVQWWYFICNVDVSSVKLCRDCLLDRRVQELAASFWVFWDLWIHFNFLVTVQGEKAIKEQNRFLIMFLHWKKTALRSAMAFPSSDYSLRCKRKILEPWIPSVIPSWFVIRLSGNLFPGDK